jgi:hypothetical protein
MRLSERSSGLPDPVQLDPPVEGAAFFSGVVAHRLGLAEPGRLQAAARDAIELQVGLDGVGAAPGQAEVVLVGAGGVGVALDLDCEIQVRLEQLHDLLEGS